MARWLVNRKLLERCRYANVGWMLYTSPRAHQISNEKNLCMQLTDSNRMYSTSMKGCQQLIPRPSNMSITVEQSAIYTNGYLMRDRYEAAFQ